MINLSTPVTLQNFCDLAFYSFDMFCLQKQWKTEKQLIISYMIFEKHLLFCYHVLDFHPTLMIESIWTRLAICAWCAHLPTNRRSRRRSGCSLGRAWSMNISWRALNRQRRRTFTARSMARSERFSSLIGRREQRSRFWMSRHTLTNLLILVKRSSGWIRARRTLRDWCSGGSIFWTVGSRRPP